MALRVYTVTLGGTTTPVQATLVGAAAAPATQGHTPFKYMRIESDASNAIAYYGDSKITTTAYAGTVLANTATANNGVVINGYDALAANVEDFWFVGTNTQKLRLTVIT